MSDFTGYPAALQAAGFHVIDFQDFGSYQGDWLAFVQYKGQYGFIRGAYGSCSGCDAFEAECDGTPEGLKKFGEQFIGDMSSYEDTLAYVKKHSSWDMEANEMVEWVKSHSFPIDFENMLNEETNE